MYIQISQGSVATNVRGGGKFLLQLPLWFISEYNSERIIKIGPYLHVFMAHDIHIHQNMVSSIISSKLDFQ